MRPARYDHNFCLPTEKPGTSPAPSGIATLITNCGADGSSDLATRIAQARRAARHHPAQAAMVLRAWMSDHG
jgi:flagellar biosynthesis/type III secretory pathway M-ring protein FliF/YscJ